MGESKPVEVIIDFEEKYDELYGIPKFEDLVAYDTTKWPETVKDYIRANADNIELAKTVSDEEYNKRRALHICEEYERLLKEHLAEDSKLVLNRIETYYTYAEFQHADDLDTYCEDRDLHIKDVYKDDVQYKFEKVMEDIMDREHLNYNDLAKLAENHKDVKECYSYPISDLNDQFTFKPELTDLTELSCYAETSPLVFEWVADAPGQLKLPLESKKIEIDSDVMAIINEDATLQTCKTNQQAIRKIYNHIHTDGYFNDNWQKVYAIRDEIETLGANCIISPLTDSHYTNGYPNDGSLSCKCYDLTITYTDIDNKQHFLSGRILCSGAGSVEDPLERYDISVSIAGGQ